MGLQWKVSQMSLPSFLQSLQPVSEKDTLIRARAESGAPQSLSCAQVRSPPGAVRWQRCPGTHL